MSVIRELVFCGRLSYSDIMLFRVSTSLRQIGSPWRVRKKCLYLQSVIMFTTIPTAEMEGLAFSYRSYRIVGHNFIFLRPSESYYLHFTVQNTEFPIPSFIVIEVFRISFREFPTACGPLLQRGTAQGQRNSQNKT